MRVISCVVVRTSLSFRHLKSSNISDGSRGQFDFPLIFHHIPSTELVDGDPLNNNDIPLNLTHIIPIFV